MQNTHLPLVALQLATAIASSLVLMPAIGLVPPVALGAGQPPQAMTERLGPLTAEPLSPLMAQTTSELEGRLWHLTSYTNNDNPVPAQPMGNQTASLQFIDGQIVGNSSCSNFFSSYELQGDELTVKPGGATLRTCPPELIAQEQAFLDGLRNVARYELTGGELRLLNARGETLLTFREEPPRALEGTLWQLTAYGTGRGRSTPLAAGTTITATFSDNGAVGGTAGCNRYLSSYDLAAGRLTIAPPDSTRMLCEAPAGVMEQEAAYLQALEATATYTIEGNVLTLKNERGATLATFTAVQ